MKYSVDVDFSWLDIIHKMLHAGFKFLAGLMSAFRLTASDMPPAVAMTFHQLLMTRRLIVF